MPCQVRPGANVLRPVLTMDIGVSFLSLRLSQAGVDSSPVGASRCFWPGIGEAGLWPVSYYGSLNL